MSKYKVEKGIELPKSRAEKSMYPWKEMEVGDSFFSTDRTAQQIGPLASYTAKKLGTKYTIRTLKDGVRVWRIK